MENGNGITRTENMDWCKQRALEYLPGDLTNAFASMFSDVGKHPETEGHAALQLGMMLNLSGNLSTEPDMRKWIEGFN